MSTRSFTLAVTAIAAFAASAMMPGTASAFGQGYRIGAPARVVPSTRVPSYRGWGYGRGWCYWHPYVCYRSR